MYNLQDMVVMPHGKISSLNSAIIAYPRCQTTWQFIAFGNVFPSLQECCCLSLALLGMQLWQGCASIQRQAFSHGLHSWSGWLNALLSQSQNQRPSGQDCYLHCRVVAFGLSMSVEMEERACPLGSLTAGIALHLHLHPVSCCSFAWQLVTCRASESSKHVSTCLSPIDVSKIQACY